LTYESLPGSGELFHRRAIRERTIRERRALALVVDHAPFVQLVLRGQHLAQRDFIRAAAAATRRGHGDAVEQVVHVVSLQTIARLRRTADPGHCAGATMRCSSHGILTTGERTLMAAQPPLTLTMAELIDRWPAAPAVLSKFG